MQSCVLPISRAGDEGRRAYAPSRSDASRCNAAESEQSECDPKKERKKERKNESLYTCEIECEEVEASFREKVIYLTKEIIAAPCDDDTFARRGLASRKIAALLASREIVCVCCTRTIPGLLFEILAPRKRRG